MSKSLKSLKIFEYRFQRFLGSKKTDSLYRDLLNNIFNIYIFEYLSSFGALGRVGRKRKVRADLLKFSKIRFLETYLLENKRFVSLSTLLKDFQRTQRFTFWEETWI